MNKILTYLKKVPQCLKQVPKRLKTASLFWKIYAAVAGLLAACGIVALIVLWNFLAAFEKSQPDRLVKEIVSELNNGKNEYISDRVEGFLSEFEAGDKIKNDIINELSDGEWTYIKRMDMYTKENPVYQLNRNGKNAGTVRLKQSDKNGSFNMAEYKRDDIDIIMPDTRYYRITVPKGATVTVNGVELSDSYISEKEVECQDISNLKGITDMPGMTVYTVKGLVKKADIKAVGAVHKEELEMEPEKEEKTDEGVMCSNITFSFENNKELIADQTERIKEISKAYSLFANHAIGLGELSKYIIPSSPAYKYMKMVADNDIWSIGRTEGDISGFEILNCQVYSDECFLCEVKFSYVVQTVVKKEQFDTHVRYVFVRKNDDYYMADFSLEK